MRTKLDMAKSFAKKWHGDQLYGDGPHPMMKHLDDVSNVLTEFGFGHYEYHVLAYLHDVLEDTDATMWDVEHEFGVDTALRVYMLTDPPLPSRRERKEELHGRFSDLSPDAHHMEIVVKLADRIANVRASQMMDVSALMDDDRFGSKLRMYCKEYTEFRVAFYRSNILFDEMWDELDQLHNVEEF